MTGGSGKTFMVTATVAWAGAALPVPEHAVKRRVNPIDRANIAFICRMVSHLLEGIGYGSVGDIDHQHQTTRLDVVVGSMVEDMTVQHPLTDRGSNEFDVIALAR